MISFLSFPFDLIKTIVDLTPCPYDQKLALTCKTLLGIVKAKTQIRTDGNEFCFGYQLGFYTAPKTVVAGVRDIITWPMQKDIEFISIQIAKSNVLVYNEYTTPKYYINGVFLWNIVAEQFGYCSKRVNSFEVFVIHNGIKRFVTYDQKRLRTNYALSIDNDCYLGFNGNFYFIADDYEDLINTIRVEGMIEVNRLLTIELLSVEDVELTLLTDSSVSFDNKVIIFQEGTRFLIDGVGYDIRDAEYTNIKNQMININLEGYLVDYSSKQIPILIRGSNGFISPDGWYQISMETQIELGIK